MEIKSWLLFAIVAMVLVSISNIVTKMLFNSLGTQNLTLDLVGKLNGTHYLMILAIAILTIISALAFLNALNSGKVALVMAVVSLSTVLMALLSMIFLGDQFSTKEIVGMALAVLSIIILAV